MATVMNETSVPVTVTTKPAPATKPAHRLFAKRVMHVVRRGHLYFGLFLFPWAILYGVTGFLFNHPNVFADQPIYPFGPREIVGTPLESLPTPKEQATALIASLNEKQVPTTPYIGNLDAASYSTRDFVFGTVKADSRTFSIIYYVSNGRGTVRETTAAARGEKAPFATGKAAEPRMRGAGMKMGADHKHGDGVKLASGVVDRFKATVPILLERFGLPVGDVVVTSAPDLKFPVEADGKTWIATYSPLSNAVSGTTPEADGTDLSVRRFLLRMHLAHGYPGETNAKWFWAIIVDIMAAVMCFWGISGLFMWWQIKGSRKLGLLTLLGSGVAASALGIAMHGFLSQ